MLFGVKTLIYLAILIKFKPYKSKAMNLKEIFTNILIFLGSFSLGILSIIYLNATSLE